LNTDTRVWEITKLLGHSKKDGIWFVDVQWKGRYANTAEPLQSLAESNYALMAEYVARVVNEGERREMEAVLHDVPVGFVEGFVGHSFEDGMWKLECEWSGNNPNTFEPISIMLEDVLDLVQTYVSTVRDPHAQRSLEAEVKEYMAELGITDCAET
jgi:hypothetical protein